MARSDGRRPMTDEQKAKVKEAGYDTGFGKPPKSARFEKGQSGNPSGRPRQPSARTILKRQLDEIIEYSENGVRRRASKKDVLFSKVFAQALTGGVRERQQLLDLMARFVPEEFQDEPSAALSKDRQTILERLFGRHGEGTAPTTLSPKDDDNEEA